MSCHPSCWPALARTVLNMPRLAKRLVVLGVDAGLCILTVWLAFYLRLGEFISLTAPGEWRPGAQLASAVAIGLAVPVFMVSGLYRAVFRCQSVQALRAVAQGVGFYGVLYASVFAAIGIPGVPRTVGLIQPLLMLVLVGGVRALAQLWLGEPYRRILRHVARPRVLVYGAGQSGRQLAVALRASTEMQAVGFVDDDDRLHGHVLDQLPIYNPDELAALVPTLEISAVLLAMPGLVGRRRRQIIEGLRSLRVAVRTLPRDLEQAPGPVEATTLRELDIDDLLGRESQPLNHILLSMRVTGKVVLVTGAGGCVGSELCRQIATLAPARLLMVEQGEAPLQAVHADLEARLAGHSTGLVPLLASVQDEERMREIMATWHPDTVFHAAAYTRIALIEHNPAEGIKNNVLGCLRTARAALETGVADFVLLSTEEAGHPLSTMGASKRLAEMVVQALAAEGGPTRFSAVRFGPVQVESELARLRQLIRDGGPVRLPHPASQRCWLGVSEAARLILQAGALTRGGEVFTLDMGPACPLADLVRRMIELAGRSVREPGHPEGDIEILYDAAPPGQATPGSPPDAQIKADPQPQPTAQPRILRVAPPVPAWAVLEGRLASLALALEVNDVAVIRLLLQELVPAHVPEAGIVDWVYLAQEAEAPALAGV